MIVLATPMIHVLLSDTQTADIQTLLKVAVVVRMSEHHLTCVIVVLFLND